MCIAQGVSPERGGLGVNTPRGIVSASSRCSSGSILFLMFCRGRACTACTLDHLPMLFRPVRGSAIRRAGARHEERLTALMVRPMRGEVRLRLRRSEI